MRLRIFDLNTPWFWLVIFYRRTDARRMELALYSPNRWRRWWLYIWQWEKLPDTRGQYEPADADVTREREADAVSSVDGGQVPR